MNHDDQIRETLRGLPLAKAPDEIWSAIERGLRQPEVPRRRFTPMLAWSMAAIVALGIGIAYFDVQRNSRPAWNVTRADGSSGFIRVGDWLQTGDSSVARITVSDIGTVEVE